MQGDEYEDQHTLIKNGIYYFVYGVLRSVRGQHLVTEYGLEVTSKTAHLERKIQPNPKISNECVHGDLPLVLACLKLVIA